MQCMGVMKTLTRLKYDMFLLSCCKDIIQNFLTCVVVEDIWIVISHIWGSLVEILFPLVNGVSLNEPKL